MNRLGFQGCGVKVNVTERSDIGVIAANGGNHLSVDVSPGLFVYSLIVSA